MKKGFTLIELLGVLAILGIIIFITAPIITDSINSSKNGAYKEQIKLIENAARTYMSKNSKDLPKTCLALRIEQIKRAGLLQNSDIKDPRSNKTMNGYVIITFKNNKYYYNYSDSNTC